MATARLGSIVADIRGSVGDEVYARNPAGIYIRARTSPSQPASAERDERQAAFTAITQAWSGTLTEAQRDTWRSYGRQHPLPDRFGRPKAMPGHCHFLRCNAQRYRVTHAITTLVAPNQPPGPPPSFEFTAHQQFNRIKFNLTDFDYRGNPDGLWLYWFTGPNMNPGRSFFNGPWRYLGSNHRAAAAWNADPWLHTHPWGLIEHDKVWTRLVAELPSHATSIRFHQSVVIVGAL